MYLSNENEQNRTRNKIQPTVNSFGLKEKK